MASSADRVSANSDSASHAASWARSTAVWASATAASLRSTAARASTTRGWVSMSTTALEAASARMSAASASAPFERQAIVELFERWGDIDGGYRKLAHRGSYENLVWVSPSTLYRVLAAQGLVLPARPQRTPAPARPLPDWIEWKRHQICERGPVSVELRECSGDDQTCDYQVGDRPLASLWCGSR